MIAAAAMLAVSCAGAQGNVPGASGVTSAPDTSAPLVTAPPPVMLSEVLGFIEVSVRIGVGETADVVALAVDSATLDELELREPPEAAAWCSGVSADPDDTDRIEEFVVLMRDPAIDVAAGGAQRFELLVSEAVLGENPSEARILVVADGVRHEVDEGLLELGDSFTSGTFRGLSAAGVMIEGAFLCG